MANDNNFERTRDAMAKVKQDVKTGVREVGDAAGAAAHHVRDDVHEGLNGVEISDLKDNMTDKMKDLAGQASDKVKDLAGQASDKAKDLAGQASDKMNEAAGTARSSIERFAINQPWQTIAFASLGGALVGALLFAGRR